MIRFKHDTTGKKYKIYTLTEKDDIVTMYKVATVASGLKLNRGDKHNFKLDKDLDALQYKNFINNTSEMNEYAAHSIMQSIFGDFI